MSLQWKKGLCILAPGEGNWVIKMDEDGYIWWLGTMAVTVGHMKILRAIELCTMSLPVCWYKTQSRHFLSCSGARCDRTCRASGEHLSVSLLVWKQRPVISPFPTGRFNSNNTACNISGHEGSDTEVLYSWLIAPVLLLNIVYTLQARWNAGETFIDDYDHLLSHLSSKTHRLKITVEQNSFY